MMRVIVVGSEGHMGRILTEMIRNAPDCDLAGRVDCCGSGGACASLADCGTQADVLIDFSSHLGTGPLLEEAVRRHLPAVICTTGHEEEELALIQRSSESIPVFFSANMSVGVALLRRLAAQVAARFDGDVEIVETHHRRKADAPSGTALALAREIQQARPGSVLCAGRSGHSPRTAGEIGISSVRRGDVAGIHEVFFSTDEETIVLTHEAHSRAVFARGALSAARFLLKKGPGLYGMDDLLDEKDVR